MQYRHELVHLEDGLSAKIFVHSVLDVTAHWHQEIELIMVLKGSVEIRREDQLISLKSDDVILINHNELHSIKATCENNILLAVQFSPDLLAHSYPELATVAFDCCSIQSHANPANYDLVRRHLAKIVWAFSKKQQWFRFSIETELMALISTLVTAFPHQVLQESRHHIQERELQRLTRIVDYISQHYADKIQLQDIAETECVTVYHLSRFFKERMGISFQEYLFDYRLHQSANQIINSGDKISDIAFDCGFNDPKLFYKKFKQKYRLTPSELRKQRSAKVDQQSTRQPSYMSVSNNEVYKPLFRYLVQDSKPSLSPSVPDSTLDCTEVVLNSAISKILPTWRKLATFGCAYEGLKQQNQQQLIEMQRDLGFEYVRFQGIFTEQMQVVYAPRQYNWQQIDALFDFLLSIRLKPFVCLGYTPDILASGSKTVARWRGNVTLPTHIHDWTHLVEAFFHHLIDRYGIKEVQTWYFEAWNEPDLEGIFWDASQDDYHQFYLATYRAVRTVDNSIRLGGPSASHMAFSQSDWLKRFVAFCLEQNLEPDFFSYHIYPERYGPLTDLESSNSVSRKTLASNGTEQLVELAKSQLAPLGISEHHVTEWNISACWGNKVLDTAYLGSFIVFNAIALFDKVESLGIWTYSDLFDERGPAPSTFHGGFGMQTFQGIKKPSYHAIGLLNKLGDELLLRNDHSIITKRANDIQILAVHYVHFDELYANGDVSAVDLIDPYSAFNPVGVKTYRFKLTLAKGTYRLSRYQLSQQHGSAYDEWQKMAMPEPLNDEDVSELKRLAHPKRTIELLTHPGGELIITMQLPAHGVELVTIGAQMSV